MPLDSDYRLLIGVAQAATMELEELDYHTSGHAGCPAARRLAREVLDDLSGAEK